MAVAVCAESMAQERLQKIIASAGLLSRRKAETAILEGRVKLNGVVVKVLGTTADPDHDVIEFDGKPVRALVEPRTFVFYKPRGVLTTKSDDRGRRTVMEFFQDVASVNPVGRLDFESEGLLLLSEDGALHLHLTHPRYGFKKVYHVWVDPAPTQAEGVWALNARKLLEGVQLEDGIGKFDSIESGGLEPQLVRVVVSEGRNRFVRRMFDAVGFTVTRLKRVQMGPVQLGDLQPGVRRELRPEERAAIQEHLEKLHPPGIEVKRSEGKS